MIVKIVTGIFCAFLVIPSIAQIKLEENKVLPKGQIKSEIYNIANMGKYYANIVAYSMICKFSDSDNQIIFDKYFQNLSQFNLSESDRDYLIKEYEKEFRLTMENNKGKSEKDSSCDKFKFEYDKILKYLK